jgi:hypothetical protein
MKGILPIAAVLIIFVLVGCSDMLEQYTVASGPASLDVMLLMDVTGSCLNALSRLKSEFSLVQKDFWIGIAGFSDFPIGGYGVTGDVPYVLYQPLSGNVDDTKNAVDSIYGTTGGDMPESQLEALYQCATGDGYDPYIQPSDTGWRKHTRKTVILITDAGFHDEEGYPGHGYAETLDVLLQKKIIVTGILLGTEGMAHADMTSITSDTHGRLYQIGKDGTGINQVITEILDGLL